MTERERYKEILQGRTYEDIITQAIKEKRDTVFIREFLNKVNNPPLKIVSRFLKWGL